MCGIELGWRECWTWIWRWLLMDLVEEVVELEGTTTSYTAAANGAPSGISALSFGASRKGEARLGRFEEE